jgi:hypothetical protein
MKRRMTKNFAEPNSLGFWRKNICNPNKLFLESSGPRRETAFPRRGAENAEKSYSLLVLRALRDSARVFRFEPVQRAGKLYVRVGAIPKNLALHPQ